MGITSYSVAEYSYSHSSSFSSSSGNTLRVDMAGGGMLSGGASDAIMECDWNESISGDAV
jgi:hypothetical protein